MQALLEEIGLVSSVYHKPAESFITPSVGPKPIEETGDEGNVELEESEENSEESEEDEDIFEEEEESNDANFVFWLCCKWFVYWDIENRCVIKYCQFWELLKPLYSSYIIRVL